mgnify:CR=1 FL=1|tara:strand:+ start:791 stop:1555 length:765 start_codon:yes stop_codon:yes gene_type:complete
MENRLKFWDERASMGYEAGSNDKILKDLEINELKKYIDNKAKILEIGCGNGFTSIEIANSFDVEIQAFDYSEKMINFANNLLKDSKNLHLEDKVKFKVFDIRKLDQFEGEFDIIITERVLINLDSFDEQMEAIKNISSKLKKGGLFLMCESSKDGLKNINTERTKFNLDNIEMPWHNNYIDDNELNSQINNLDLELIEINNFSSTYYFLSRIIYANYAKMNNEEIKYDSVINKMSMKLPSFGNYSQTKIWVWKK